MFASLQLMSTRAIKLIRRHMDVAYEYDRSEANCFLQLHWFIVRVYRWDMPPTTVGLNTVLQGYGAEASVVRVPLLSICDPAILPGSNSIAMPCCWSGLALRQNGWKLS